MSGERILAVEEKIAQLMSFEASLKKIEADPNHKYSPVVVMAYRWLHEKINSYLLHPTSSQLPFDENQLQEYLSIQITKIGKFPTGRKGSGRALMLDLSVDALKRELAGIDNVGLEARFIAFFSEVKKYEGVSSFKFCVKNGLSKNKAAFWESNFIIFKSVIFLIELCAQLSTEPTLTKGILTIIETDPLELITQITNKSLIKAPDQVEALESVVKKINNHTNYARLLLLNLVVGLDTLVSIEIRKKEFTDFESYLKKNAVKN